MFMPKQFKRDIYAQLFREGVLLVEEKPLDMHPDLKGIPNLNVLKTMKSLKSQGYVKKQFAWSHSFYFLNNEGIEFLRNYLHLPQEKFGARWLQKKFAAYYDEMKSFSRNEIAVVPLAAAKVDRYQKWQMRHL